MKNIEHFFIFANRLKDKYGDLDNFLYNHKDYNSNSVFVLLNKAEPLVFDSVASFNRKWIFFRVLSNTTVSKYRIMTFRDPSLLTQYNFEYYGCLPDSGEPYKIFRNTISSLNVSPNNLYPYSLEYNDTHHYYVHRLKKNVPPWAKQKTLSSGLWLYVHLKQMFSNAKFTFIGFNAHISPKFHNADVEKELLLEIFQTDNVEQYNCIS